MTGSVIIPAAPRHCLGGRELHWYNADANTGVLILQNEGRRPDVTSGKPAVSFHVSQIPAIIAAIVKMVGEGQLMEIINGGADACDTTY